MTLIELMVVIALIAIIAALLVPGISKARDSGKKSLCMNNLHQISMGLLQYVEVLDGNLPTRSFWTRTGEGAEQLLPYIRNVEEVFTCPSFKGHFNFHPITKGDRTFSGSHTNDYEINGYLTSYPGNVPRRMNQIYDASLAAYTWDLYYNDETLRAHSRGVNVAYMDGHAGWLDDEGMGSVWPGPEIFEDTFFLKGHAIKRIESGF